MAFTEFEGCSGLIHALLEQDAVTKLLVRETADAGCFGYYTGSSYAGCS
jgi:hypothetical protein